MIGSSMLPGWATVVVAVPILGVLAMTMFGLDGRCANPKRRHGSRRLFCEAGGDGPTDPDGRPWKKAANRRVEAQLVPVGGPGWEVPGQSAQAGSARGTIISGYVIEKG